MFPFLDSTQNLFLAFLSLNNSDNSTFCVCLYQKYWWLLYSLFRSFFNRVITLTWDLSYLGVCFIVLLLNTLLITLIQPSLLSPGDLFTAFFLLALFVSFLLLLLLFWGMKFKRLLDIFPTDSLYTCCCNIGNKKKWWDAKRRKGCYWHLIIVCKMNIIIAHSRISIAYNNLGKLKGNTF